MKTHPELGAGLLGHFESYREISAIILAHQEHFDGSGYPRGLKGEGTPLFARIIGIADTTFARVDMGAANYNIFSSVDGMPAVALAVREQVPTPT